MQGFLRINEDRWMRFGTRFSFSLSIGLSHQAFCGFSIVPFNARLK